MKKNVFLILTLLLFVTTTFSQIYISADSEIGKKIISRPLLVELYPITGKEIDKLKVDDKASYLRWANDYNEFVKIVFKKYWTLHRNPTFLTYDEIKEYIKTNGTEYSVFQQRLFSESRSTDAMEGRAVPYKYEFSITKKGKIDDEETISLSVMSRADTDEEFRFVLVNLNKYVKAQSEGKPYKDESLYNKEENFKIVSEKILLLTKDMLDTTRITQDEVLKVYQHKARFVTSDELYSAMQSQDKNSLFLTYLLNQTFGIWMYAIVDASTMNVIAMHSQGGVHFSIGRQFTSNSHAVQLSNKLGGSPYSYKEPFAIWRSRSNVQLTAKDFKIMGSQKAINMNYGNPLTR